MFKGNERIIAFFVALMAFLMFWSPILILVLTLIFVMFFVLKLYYFKRRSDPQITNKSGPKLNLLNKSDERFGVNRQNRTGKRQESRRNTSDNYISNYSLNSVTNQFLQSDSFVPSISGQTFSGRPHTSSQISYSPFYPSFRDSPTSQLGNIPFVKLSSGSEQLSNELKRSSPVKAVTVRIAPMPQNLAKMTFSRLSSNNTTANASTLGAIDTSMETTKPLDPKLVVDAIRKSLRRKREPKNDIESEDMIISSANKKQKRDSNELNQMANGMIPSNKQSIKRQAMDGTELFQKRFRNNEIMSSYSSLQSTHLSQSLKNKRKLSPDLKEPKEVKTQKTDNSNVEEEKEVIVVDEPKPKWNLNIEDETQFKFANEMSLNFNAKSEGQEKSALKKSYGLPIHLHSMEDHERDRNKTKSRLNRFLNAVKEVKSPSSESNEEIITSEESPLTIESSAESTTEIGLPSVPAAAIFTTSRVETSVTTTLLNTPISSVLTTTKESISPQNISVDTIEPILTINSAPNWPQNPTFTAKPVATQSLFSVGTGGSSTNRRIAQNSRLRSRQKR